MSVRVVLCAPAPRSKAFSQAAAWAEDLYRRLQGQLVEVARRWQAVGNLPADAIPEQVGALLLSLGQGFILQRLLVSGANSDACLAGVRALPAVAPAGTPDRVSRMPAAGHGHEVGGLPYVL